MKEKPSLSPINQNITGNYFSKQLYKYDNELTFDKILKTFFYLHKKTPIFKNNELQKLFQQQKKTDLNGFSQIKSRINEAKPKPKFRSFSPMNEISKKKRISYFPQISPYILSNKSSILIDYNKALEMGSEGFKYLCNNENQNIKDILFAYNDHNFKSLKDFNSFAYFNKVNESNNNMEQNEDEKNPINDSILLQNNFMMENNKDIFDKKFKKRNRISKIKKLLINKSNRIKNQNNKANKLYKQYKNLTLKKKGIFIHLNINYNSIEKHTPHTSLNSQTERVSPEDMVHKYFNYNYQKKKKITLNKKIEKINNETKEKFFVTNRSINLCSENIKNFNFDL